MPTVRLKPEAMMKGEKKRNRKIVQPSLVQSLVSKEKKTTNLDLKGKGVALF